MAETSQEAIVWKRKIPNIDITKLEIKMVNSNKLEKIVNPLKSPSHDK